MSNFKLAKKDHLTDTRSNIYDLHEKKLEYFETEKKKLPEYVSELKTLQLEYSNIIEADLRYNLSIKIQNLENRIECIQDDTELNDYLLDFVSVIHEADKNNSFENMIQKGSMDTFVNASINTSKIDLYNEYITKFNPELKSITVNKTEKTVCAECQSDIFIFDYKINCEICQKCGITTNLLFQTDNSIPVYTENIEQVIVFNYKRNNHFQECLNQLQAKENTTIPPKIIQQLTAEFKKYGITNPKMITSKLVKSYLKKLNYSKYYEHIPTIINDICGLPAPKLTNELEQQLKIMFDEIQQPFEKYSHIICPLRKNFLNYNYVFYKMCELLSKDEFLNYFPLLKCREKLYEHDKIWKGICIDCKWEFIPTI